VWKTPGKLPEARQNCRCKAYLSSVHKHAFTRNLHTGLYLQ
jgi:hypothetical protein